MGLLEGSKETFLSRLQHTAVKPGTYLVMPNAQKPAFLVPAYSRIAFKIGIDLIKPISRKGEVKKNLIKKIPLWLLRIKFPTITIDNPNCGDRDAVILPWNQDVKSKITIIFYDLNLNNVEVEKFAFADKTRKMVRNEKLFLDNLKGDPESKIIVPEVKEFIEEEKYTCLTQEFYFGNYVETITSNLLAFFDKLNTDEILSLEDHPYVLEKYPMMMGKLVQFECYDLFREMETLYHEYRKDKFQVATMHSDFSTTNTVHTDDDKFVIIDWEDAQENGINIDIPFFNFRRQLFEKGSWKIENAESFLVVFHYVWFMVSKANIGMLQSFKIDKRVFST